VSRGDRNRNARLARLREAVPVTNAIAGIDLADSMDRPGDLGGSDPWKDAESCQHSGNTLMSCVNAR
jgi:hypothetical protein